MAKVSDIAKYVRSKNAGPFWVTLEIFCDTLEAFNAIKNSPNICPSTIARLYGADESLVQAFYLENILVIKFSYPRPKPEGHKYENDMHAGQQYVFLAETEV